MNHHCEASRRIVLAVLFMVACVLAAGCAKAPGSKENKSPYKTCPDISVKDTGWHIYSSDQEEQPHARYVVKIANRSKKTYRKAVLDVTLRDSTGRDVLSERIDLPVIRAGKTFYYCGVAKIKEDPLTHIKASVKYSKDIEELARIDKKKKPAKTTVSDVKSTRAKVRFKLKNRKGYIENGYCSVIVRKNKKIYTGYMIPVKDCKIKKKAHMSFQFPEKIPKGSSVKIYYADCD